MDPTTAPPCPDTHFISPADGKRYRKVDLFNNPEYNACKLAEEMWKEKNGKYYSSILCLKECRGCGERTIKEAYGKMQPFITNSLEEVLEHNEAKLCILPKGHRGGCRAHCHSSLFTHSALQNSLSWIYTTEGDDDYVYKNRASRTFPIAISDSFEKKIKDKDVRLRCAIPLKNASSPLLLASAYLDYLTLHSYINGVVPYINSSFVEDNQFQSVFESHREHMQTHFSGYNRRIFNEIGHTLCPVMGTPIDIRSTLDNDRCNPTGIQLGHVEPRNNESFTIRGLNLLIMTRTGNRLVGEHHFLGQEWLDILRNVIAFASGSVD